MGTLFPTTDNMIDYNVNAEIDNKLGSEGYRELTKVLNHIAKKCNLKKEVCRTYKCVEKIILRYNNGNKPCDFISLSFHKFEDYGVVYVYTNNKYSIEGNINDFFFEKNDFAEMVSYITQYAENIVQNDYMKEVYNKVCKRAEKLSIGFSCKFVEGNYFDLEIENTTGKKIILSVMYRLDYAEQQNDYWGFIYENETTLNIEIANDKISFLVNACMYHLRLEEMEEREHKNEV